MNIFVGNNLIIDFDIYSLWIDGYTIDESKEHIMRTSHHMNLKESIVMNDIVDNFAIFNKLEQFLYNPIRLREQIQYQITDENMKKLIEKYYEYNSSVVREILGHKLTQRQRKDLDDVCEKTEVRVKSCRRQFDNLKRIMRVTDEMRGSLTRSIMESFLLPLKMAEDYAAIVFLTRNQFELSKKKLSHLTSEDFIHCANLITKNWSSSSSTNAAPHDSESDISRDFLINLKDLKILVERDFIEDHKKLVLSGICKALNLTKDTRSIQTLDGLFKELSKALVEIAYALNHSKDMKDLFYDLEEKFIEPCKEENLSRAELKAFLDEYRRKAHLLQDICRDNPKLLTVFDRYIITVSNCILQMYHS